MQAERGIRHFAALPIEVRDLIAEYLVFKDRESDAEFIKRVIEGTTAIPSPLSHAHCKQLMPNGSGLARSESMGLVAIHHYKALASYLPDRSKILFVEKFWTGEVTRGIFNATPKASLIDIKHNTKRADAYLTELVQEKMDNLSCIALSHDGNLIVRVFETHCNRPYACMANDIVVHNKQTGEQKNLGRGYDIASCEFNKQGTKIIAFSKGEKSTNHTLYSYASEQEHAIKSKKTLAEYLRQKGVCSNLANSLR